MASTWCIISKLANIDELCADYPDLKDEKSCHSILELTVKKWFAYLHSLMKGSEIYSSKYPKLWVSLHDLFLDETRKNTITRLLNVTIGKRVEEEMIWELQKQLQSDMMGNNNESVEKHVIPLVSNSNNQNAIKRTNSNSSTKTKRKRRAVTSTS